ncbi:MAG TPA: CsiV family protein, partial [Pseudomonadales bacterium]
MTHPVRRRLAAALSLIPLLAAAVAGAAPKLEAHFTRSWYVAEVIVFLRPGEHDYLNEERLTGPPTPLAASLRSFRLSPAERIALYALAPFTRVHLTYPYLDAERLDPFAPLTAEVEPASPDEALAPGVPPPVIRPRLAPDPLLDFLRQVAEFEASLEEQSYRPLGAESFTLKGEAQALTRRAGYRILLHRRWLQPVPAREHPEPLFVQAGTRYADGFALEGTLDVTQGRYLHFGAHLLYREPLLGRAPLDRALPPRRTPGLDARDNP